MKTRYENWRLPVSRLASAVAVVFLLFSTNDWETGAAGVSTALFTLGMFLVAIGSLGRMWCSLYIAGYKDQVLITQGPYSLTRNPLYFFSVFGALGVGFCTETFTFPALLLAVMVLYYPLVVRKEERRLREGPPFCVPRAAGRRVRRPQRRRVVPESRIAEPGTGPKSAWIRQRTPMSSP